MCFTILKDSQQLKENDTDDKIWILRKVLKMVVKCGHFYSVVYTQIRTDFQQVLSIRALRWLVKMWQKHTATTINHQGNNIIRICCRFYYSIMEIRYKINYGDILPSGITISFLLSKLHMLLP